MSLIIRTEKPPFMVKVKVGPGKILCDALIRTDRYFSRMPLQLRHTLGEVLFEKLNETLKSVEAVNDCIGLVRVDIQMEDRILKGHKVLVTTDDNIFSLGTITLCAFGANIHFRTNKFSLGNVAVLTELQTSRIFKSQYEKFPESSPSPNYLKHVQCYGCQEWGHYKATCKNTFKSRSSPYSVNSPSISKTLNKPTIPKGFVPKKQLFPEAKNATKDNKQTKDMEDMLSDDDLVLDESILNDIEKELSQDASKIPNDVEMDTSISQTGPPPFEGFTKEKSNLEALSKESPYLEILSKENSNFEDDSKPEDKAE